MLIMFSVAYYCFPCTYFAMPLNSVGGGPGVLYRTSLDVNCSCHFLPGSSLLALLGIGMEWINSALGLGCTGQFL